MLQKVTLHNILSFKELTVELRNLNVLVGPNASGKSNFIEVLGLLQAAPRDLPGAIQKGGGIAEWKWKGKPDGELLLQVTVPHGLRFLAYKLELHANPSGPPFSSESLTTQTPFPGHSSPYIYFDKDKDLATVNTFVGEQRPKRSLKREDTDAHQSLLAQIKDPVQYPEIAQVAKLFDRIRLYRDWNMGRSAQPRQPQPADMPNDFLREDAANLGLVLNRMERDGSLAKVEKYLSRFLRDYKRLSIQVQLGTGQLFLGERDLASLIPATRLSDGTLRFLGLMAVLCHAELPPLICIEEPELGLHPDAVRIAAEALREAAQKTQVVITTHSDALVDELSDEPESIIVCERNADGSSRFRRLVQSQLEVWLDEYRLGELWRRGELGGTL